MAEFSIKLRNMFGKEQFRNFIQFLSVLVWYSDVIYILMLRSLKAKETLIKGR